MLVGSDKSQTIGRNHEPEVGELEPIANISERVPDPAADYDPDLNLIPTPADSDAPPPFAVVAINNKEKEATQPQIDNGESDDKSQASDLDRPSRRVASFHGVTPGETTREQLLNAWGKPEDSSGESILTYRFSGFPSVAVRLSGDLVQAVQVSLAEPIGAVELAARLKLGDVRPAVERDIDGAAVATAFPGRGVVFGHQQDLALAVVSDVSQQVSLRDGYPTYKILIRTIGPEAYLLRAMSTSRQDYAGKIADLETAIEIDPTNVEARLMLSNLALSVGQAELAEELASEAVDLRPRDSRFRLQLAKCFMQLAKYDQAVVETRRVLDDKNASPLVRAQATHQMGLLAALGNKEVAKQAIGLHSDAIELADKLALVPDSAVASDANRLLVEAHLAIAERIAFGDWQQKDDSVAQWIGRASALTEQMIVDGRGDELLRLKVALSALRSAAHLEPPIDPELWITEAEEAVDQLDAKSTDEFAKAERDWQLGLAYLYASEIQHRRGEADRSIYFGERAQTEISKLADIWSGMPDCDFIVGRMLFQNGAVLAVHNDDHKAACEYYDQALSLLMQPTPVTALASPSRHGDALISMGVSYWKIGQRDRAYELTKAGFDLIQQAVVEGLVDRSALEVSQSNLASMERAMGIPGAKNGYAKTQVASRIQQNLPKDRSTESGVISGERSSSSTGRTLRR